MFKNLIIMALVICLASALLSVQYAREIVTRSYQMGYQDGFEFGMQNAIPVTLKDNVNIFPDVDLNAGIGETVLYKWSRYSPLGNKGAFRKGYMNWN